MWLLYQCLCMSSELGRDQVSSGPDSLGPSMWKDLWSPFWMHIVNALRDGLNHCWLKLPPTGRQWCAQSLMSFLMIPLNMSLLQTWLGEASTGSSTSDGNLLNCHTLVLIKSLIKDLVLKDMCETSHLCANPRLDRWLVLKDSCEVSHLCTSYKQRLSQARIGCGISHFPEIFHSFQLWTNSELKRSFQVSSASKRDGSKGRGQVSALKNPSNGRWSVLNWQRLLLWDWFLWWGHGHLGWGESWNVL